MTHAVNLAAVDLRCRANGITGRGHVAEATCYRVQHALAEALLRAVRPTAEAMEFVLKAIHGGNGSNSHSQACRNLTYVDNGRRIVWLR